VCGERGQRDTRPLGINAGGERESGIAVAWLLGLTAIVCLAEREMLWFSVAG